MYYFAVEGASIEDVLLSLFAIDCCVSTDVEHRSPALTTKSLGNLKDALRPEGAFSVWVKVRSRTRTS